MNGERTGIRPNSMRLGLAALAGAALLTGAVWHAQAVSAVDMQTRAVAAPTAGRTASLASGRDSYADIVSVVAPAVVTIRTEGRARVSPTGLDEQSLRRFFGGPFFEGPDEGQSRTPQQMPRQRGLGSGVIVGTDGYILTNYHVVNDADRILVDLPDSRTVKGRLVGSDQPSDLALIKVDADHLQALSLGDSDAVRVGDVVLAVGNPLGIGQTVTMGIVSAKGRSTGVGDGSYEDFLQTDAPINHGNSGGALVNMKGELVGINSQIVSMSDGNIGIGFAIPANMARQVMDALRSDGRVHRALLGVTVQPVTSDLAESLGLTHVTGAIVSGVESGGAADRAGIKRGDVITSFNGRPVDDTNTLRNRVAAAKPGSSASVVVMRDGHERQMSVTLSEAAAPKNARRGERTDGGDHAALGVTVAPLTPELAARAGLDRSAKGLLIQDVDPDSRAAEAGLRPRDVIQEANRAPVDSVDALRAAVKQAGDHPVLLLVSREGKDLFVTVRPS